MSRRARAVEIGQSYQELGEGPFGQPRRRVWRVQRLYQGGDGITYAQISDPKNGSVKTIAQGILLDRSFYLPGD